MFKLEKLDVSKEGKELRKADDLFHLALSMNPDSHERFHVTNDKGEDFDIVYLDNDSEKNNEKQNIDFTDHKFSCYSTK